MVIFSRASPQYHSLHRSLLKGIPKILSFLLHFWAVYWVLQSDFSFHWSKTELRPWKRNQPQKPESPFLSPQSISQPQTAPFQQKVRFWFSSKALAKAQIPPIYPAPFLPAEHPPNAYQSFSGFWLHFLSPFW